MGTDGGKSRTKSYFLKEDVCRSRREQGKRDGRCGRVGAKSDRFVALGAKSSSRDNSRVKFNNGRIKQRVGATWEQRNTGKVSQQ